MFKEERMQTFDALIKKDFKRVIIELKTSIYIVLPL